MFLNSAKFRRSINPSESGTRFSSYIEFISVWKKSDVKNSALDLQEFRTNFEQYSREHEQKGKWACNLLIGS